jgi:outer membrane biosynthesis protein TonB
MKSAIVELRGCISYSHGNRTFQKDQAQTVVDEAMLDHLIGTRLFSIRPLEEAAPPAPKPVPKPAPAPEVEEEVEVPVDEPEESVKEARAAPPPPPKVEPKKAAPSTKKQRRGLFK